MSNLNNIYVTNGITVIKKKRKLASKKAITLHPGGCMCGKLKKVGKS
ncbi:hypothetical protein ACQKP0_11880 [Heyndrickxia sp. NPDC080065]